MTLSLLGNKVQGWASPNQAVLETIRNPSPIMDYCVRFTCPEFTSMCPVTGQPDFACIIIDYVPKQLLVESKALKLFLASFRNHPDFHEACTLYISERLVTTLSPKWFRIAAFWYPRGGIPIDVFWQSAEPPTDLYIPPLDMHPYRGR